MGDPTAAGGARPKGAGRVHSASRGSHTVGGRAGGWLTPEGKLTIEGDDPFRSGCDAATFEDMR